MVRSINKKSRGKALLYCQQCGEKYGLNEPRWQCRCGSVLDIRMEARFSRDKIKKRKPTLWRYREALAVRHNAGIISFDEGFTPLILMRFQGFRVGVKLEFLFPTGSFKDRGATVLVSKINELGIKEVVGDSSGNAGAAIAAYCAAAHIGCNIYVPESISAAKLTQMRTYGAKLVRVPGSREEAAQAALKIAQKTYYASHYWNPFFLQGTKTYAFEVWEQLGWEVPVNLILPVGHGTLLLGAYLGFWDLRAAGMIEKVPKIFAVQSESCSPLYQAFHQNLDFLPQITGPESLAEGIHICKPLRWKQLIEAVRVTGGTFLTVSEEEIISSVKEAGRRGFFVEPTSATVVAALEKLTQQNLIDPEELTVIPLTGTGLKTRDKISSRI
jgi:threonine synthase